MASSICFYTVKWQLWPFGVSNRIPAYLAKRNRNVLLDLEEHFRNWNKSMCFHDAVDSKCSVFACCHIASTVIDLLRLRSVRVLANFGQTPNWTRCLVWATLLNLELNFAFSSIDSRSILPNSCLIRQEFGKIIGMTMIYPIVRLTSYLQCSSASARAELSCLNKV